MTITNQLGWLERSWLNTQWLAILNEDSTNAQIDIFITNNNDINYSQIDLKINDVEEVINSQIESIIIQRNDINAQIERKIETQAEINAQIEKIIIDSLSLNNAQTLLSIDKLNIVKAQIEKFIIDKLEQNGVQIEKKIDSLEIIGSQIYSSNLYWVLCAGWLEFPWLTKTWLTNKICAGARTQIEMRIDTEFSIGAQVERRIDKQEGIYSQVEMRIDVQTPINAQIERFFVERINSQILIVLYNVTRPRILCEFPSRGITGLNWTATDTKAGDFSVLNINNDISEFYYRSNDGVTTVTLTCDTEVTQGIFLDTFYMEGHNLSRSAVVVLEGSNDPGFSTVGKSENLSISDTKIFYVEPTLPTISYRYWRLLISDPSNAYGYIKIGLVIFGRSNILNSECTTQEIIVTPIEFKNSVRTEGFTSVANSRSLKKSILLNFQNISYDTGDYTILNDAINYSRTTLKCLWIPDPRTRSMMERFAVFGKITKMPEQRHNVKGINENMDFIDFSIEINEAE